MKRKKIGKCLGAQELWLYRACGEDKRPQDKIAAATYVESLSSC